MHFCIISTHGSTQSSNGFQVSLQPKAFKVSNFLSEFETNYIVQQASPRLGRSTVGHGEDARDSNTRTSKSAWLNRGHSEVSVSLYILCIFVSSIKKLTSLVSLSVCPYAHTDVSVVDFALQCIVASTTHRRQSSPLFSVERSVKV